MSKKTKYSSATPEKPKGVGFFNHFPANFLKPYGLANDPPTPEMLQRRTNPKSCEWLIRPNFAMSEFCATMHENLEYLEKVETDILDKFVIGEIIKNFQPFLPSLKRLNTKNEKEPQAEDITSVLTMLYDDDSPINEVMAQFFKLGGAMFTTAIQFFVAQHLLSDTDSYASRMATDDDRCKTFQCNHDLKSLKDMLLKLCVMKLPKQTTAGKATTPNRSLLAQLKALQKTETATTSSTRQIPLSDPSSDSSDSSSDSSDSSSSASAAPAPTEPSTSKKVQKSSKSKQKKIAAKQSTQASTSNKRQAPAERNKGDTKKARK